MLKIAKLGAPALRQIAQPVPSDKILKSSFQQFLDDLLNTMVVSHSLALAATQVESPDQVIVVQGAGDDASLTRVLINPTIVDSSSECAEGWEGCLSVDRLYGKIKRPITIRVEFLDRNGKGLELDLSGLQAACIQHAMDHLSGKLFLDRLISRSELSQAQEFYQYWPNERAEVM